VIDDRALAPPELHVAVRPPERRRDSRNGPRWRGSATLDPPVRGCHELWFEIPAVDGWEPCASADPYVLGVLQPAMVAGRTVSVSGAAVSPSLLANLVDVQRAWRDWRGWPLVDVRVDRAVERPAPSSGTVLAYSGGVDSAYSLLRHVTGQAGPQTRAIDLALFAHGFDIDRRQDEVFLAALGRIAPPVEALGVRIVPAVTNLRDLTDNWEPYHGFALAATLTFAGGSHAAGMIAASDTFARPMLGWGSNQMTDRLLGSDGFEIVHDACGVVRIDKVRALSAAPDLFTSLRFCWAGASLDRNCGRCAKCVLMAMILRVLDLPPTCFDEPVADEVICDVLERSGWSGFTITYNEPVLAEALARGIDAEWVSLLRRRVRRARYEPALATLSAPLRRRLPARIAARLPAWDGKPSSDRRSRRRP
jgi:hypothetical protein